MPTDLWYSPEILRPGGFGLTKITSDQGQYTYAFNMLAYEVGSDFWIILQFYSDRAVIFSGRLPFFDSNDAAVVGVQRSTFNRVGFCIIFLIDRGGACQGKTVDGVPKMVEVKEHFSVRTIEECEESFDKWSTR